MTPDVDIQHLRAVVLVVDRLLAVFAPVTSMKTPKDRVRRYVVQDYVADALGVKRNNWLCYIVWERLERQGIKRSIHRGDNYFEIADTP